jgi:hypothetical protein
LNLALQAQSTTTVQGQQHINQLAQLADRERAEWQAEKAALKANREQLANEIAEWKQLAAAEIERTEQALHDKATREQMQ